MIDPERALAIAEASRSHPATGHWSDVVAQSVAARVFLRRGQHLAALPRFEEHMVACLRDGMKIEFSYSAAAAAGCLAALGQAQDAAVIHGAFCGGTEWVNQVDAERVADELIEQAMPFAEYQRLAKQGAAMDFADAAEFALTALREVLSRPT